MQVAFGPEGLRVATGSDDKTVRVWDARTGQPLTSRMVHEKGVTGLRFSPDGKRILAIEAERAVTLWDVGPVESSVEDLQDLAVVLSGRRIDASESLSLLPVEELMPRLAEIKRRCPEFFR